MSFPSAQLRGMFHIIEMAAFQEWKDAGPKRRKEITSELGAIEGKAIMKEIEAASEKKYPTP